MTYRSQRAVSGKAPERGFGYTSGRLADTSLEITPEEVKAKIDAGEAIRLVDVREPSEHAICRISGAELIPMGYIPQCLNDLEDDERLMVVYCHHGVRSLSVVDWLHRHGVENCLSMSGGIDRWSTRIDPTVPRY